MPSSKPARRFQDILDLGAAWRIVEHDLPKLRAACVVALDGLKPGERRP